MNRRAFIVLMAMEVVSMAVTGCSESVEIDTSLSTEPDIIMENSSVKLSLAGKSFLDFVASTEYEGYFDLGGASLVFENDDKKTPVDYRICGIEKISDKPERSHFRVYFEDLCRSRDYNDFVRLKLNNRNNDHVYSSLPFNVSFCYEDTTKILLNTGIPLVLIETIDRKEPSADYIQCPVGLAGSSIRNAMPVPCKVVMVKDTVVLYNSGDYEKDKSGADIKIRGNSSAVRDRKKPYKIKLQKKADLLSRGDDKKYKDKNWVLLKHDGLKTFIGMKVSELMGLNWTPAYQFVNVIMNGQYRGLYMLAESVRRNNECRLSVSDSGYIIEYDAYWWNEDVYFISDYHYQMNYTFKYPDEDDITRDQIVYIKQYIDRFETAILNGTYDQYIDVPSWAKWVLTQDILGNGDGAGSNIFFTKYDDSDTTKLVMNNLWDMEGIYEMPNDFSRQHTGTIHYFYKLFSSDNEIFKNTYKKLWYEVSSTIFNEISDFILEYEKSNLAKGIEKSVELDNNHYLYKIPWPSSYEDVENAKLWFSTRKSILEDKIKDLN